MWSFLEFLKPVPRTQEELCWNFVSRGLASDARLFASGLEAARRPACGSWARMLLECEIAAVRLWAVCGVMSHGSNEKGNRLSQSTEMELRAWLTRKRRSQLQAYTSFNWMQPMEALDTLATLWRIYAEIPADADKPKETVADVMALFWGRCINGYTNKPVEDFIGQGEREIDAFVPKYLQNLARRAHLLAAENNWLPGPP